MKNVLIEALKSNEKPFGLMGAELQVASNTIGMSDFQRYSSDEGWRKSCAIVFLKCDTYRLKSDYQLPAESEIVACKIIDVKSASGFYSPCYLLDGAKVSLDLIPNGYMLVGFKFDGIKQIINKDFGYSNNGVDILPFAELDNIRSGKDKVLQATHVIFRGVK